MKTNNLYKPVSYKVVILALLITLIVLAPQILSLVYPGNEIIVSITEGKGWYLYLLSVGVILSIIEYKIKKHEEDN